MADCLVTRKLIANQNFNNPVELVCVLNIYPYWLFSGWLFEWRNVNIVVINVHL
jgi:hypothetical protein